MTNTPVETEIKLRAHPDDLPAVREAIEAATSPDGPASTKHLESRYFDTPARTLAGRQVALRVRKTDQGFVQTVKSARDAGGTLFARGEWEAPVDSFSPRLDEEPGILSPEILSELDMLFATEIDREKLVATYPRHRPNASIIEIAFDSGVIRSDDRVQRVSEVELELVSGSPADLLDLALRLAEQLPLQLGTESKSARGYRLADNEIPMGIRADGLQFDKHISLEDGMRESLRACVRQWFANQEPAFDGRDIEGVHQMRVALRRLRSALTFFGDFISEPPLGGFKEDARWVAGSLGPARDWDVFMAETLPAAQDSWISHEGLRALEESAGQMRERAYDTARVMLTSPRYTAFALRMSAWIERSGWRGSLDPDLAARLSAPMSDLASSLLDRRYRKVMKAGRRFNKLTEDERHELRIILKRLRYAGDFFRSLYPRKAVRPFRAAMMDMLEKLGKLNDMTVAQQLCRELIDQAGDNRDEILSGAEALLSWHEAHGHVAESAMRKNWQALEQAAPYWR